MNTQLAKLKRVAIFLAGISTVSIPAMVHADWSIKGLGTLGGNNSYAHDINDSGQVVGMSNIASGHPHAFITGPNGIGMTDLGTLGGDTSEALGINDSGQVVGSSHTGSGYYRAFITGPNGIGMTDLGTLGEEDDYSNSTGSGVNNSGQVVGRSYTESRIDLTHAFITGPNGVGMTDLGTLGGNYTWANGINDSGQVAGSSYIESNGNFTHAFITGPNGVGMTDLGSLGGDYTWANGINDSGQVVGSSHTGSRSDLTHEYFTHAFITGPNGVGMTDLGTLGGYQSGASGINDSGEVVGNSAPTIVSGPPAPGEASHSFLFSHGGITDLSLLAPVVATGLINIVVNSINNNGQMVGYGLHHSTNRYGYDLITYQAFLLSYTPDTVFDPKPVYIPPVPEPEIYLMLLSGLGLIGCLAWRRKETTI